MSLPVVLSSFGGDAAVTSVSTHYPFQAGVDVPDAVQGPPGEQVQIGTFSVAGTAAGTATEAITLSTAFPTACDAVLLTLTSLGGAVINGGPVAADVAPTGFTATVTVTTAGTAAITGYWLALGH
jgi:hypothetical protein